jgi:hypothetical protein
MDWSNVELRVFSTDNSPVTGLFSLPEGDPLKLKLDQTPSGVALKNDPFAGKVKWQISRAPAK